MTDDARTKSREVWDEMASGWDRHSDYLSRTGRPVAEWLVDNVDAREGDTILDLAGGTGDNGFLAAERVGSSGKVIVSDFAPEMVAVAERRASEAGLSNVETRVLDAESMDIADDRVDGIICRWGFMLMLDPQKAMKECRRVLKPGRSLALSVWGGPKDNPWITITGMSIMQMGHQPGGDPFGPGGMFSLADHDKIRSMLIEAGFESISTDRTPVVWASSSFDEAWDFMTNVAGAVAALVKQLPDDEIAKLRSILEANMQPYRDGPAISLPGLTLNAAAS